MCRSYKSSHLPQPSIPQKAPLANACHCCYRCTPLCHQSPIQPASNDQPTNSAAHTVSSADNGCYFNRLLDSPPSTHIQETWHKFDALPKASETTGTSFVLETQHGALNPSCNPSYVLLNQTCSTDRHTHPPQSHAYCLLLPSQILQTSAATLLQTSGAKRLLKQGDSFSSLARRASLNHACCCAHAS